MARSSDSESCCSDDDDLKSIKSAFSSRGRKTAYPCPYSECEKFFSRPSRLKAHMCVHTGEKSFHCPHEGCGQSYARNSHLKRHLANKHSTNQTPTKKFPCQECPKTFANQYGLSKHFKLHHSVGSRLKCDECGETFTKKGFLRTHKFKEHGESVDCLKCEKKFKSEFLMRSHLRKVHTEKTYKCDQCSETFDKWTLVRKHVSIVHNQKTRCEVCDKKIKCCNLKDHMKTHQDKTEFFHCPHDGCDRFYNRMKNLTAHIRSCHEAKEFPCKWDGCKSVLRSEKSLKSHVRKCHTHKKAMAPPKTGAERAVRRDRVAMAAKLSGIADGRVQDPKPLDPIDILLTVQSVASPAAISDDEDSDDQPLPKPKMDPVSPPTFKIDSKKYLKIFQEKERLLSKQDSGESAKDEVIDELPHSDDSDDDDDFKETKASPEIKTKPRCDLLKYLVKQ